MPPKKFHGRYGVEELRARNGTRSTFDDLTPVELFRKADDAAGERGVEPLDVSVSAHRAPKPAHHRHVALVRVVRRCLEIGQVPTNLRRRHRREIAAEHRTNPLDGRRIELGPVALARLVRRYTEESGDALTDPHYPKSYDPCALHAVAKWLPQPSA